MGVLVYCDSNHMYLYLLQFSVTEGVIAAFVDEYPDTLRVGNRPMIMRGCLCFLFFCLGLPMVTQVDNTHINYAPNYSNNFLN